MHCTDGEFHIGYGDDKWLVYNVEQLYKDLPFIIQETIRENNKMQKIYLDNIKQELKEL